LTVDSRQSTVGPRPPAAAAVQTLDSEVTDA
jgi:hypothetical protein